MTKNSNKIKKLGLLILSLGISVLIVLNKDNLAELEEYGYIGIFLLSVLGNATVIIPAPVILTAFVGGSIFNPYLVGLISALGATFGELTGYMAGYGGKAFLEEKEKYKKIKGWIEKRGFITIFTLAVIPNPLFDLAGIFAGGTNYPLSRFFVATFLGKTIKFVAVALIGSYALQTL
ncbi:MAG: VTT domain-containing protein [Patescibacteria group bacterium]